MKVLSGAICRPQSYAGVLNPLVKMFCLWWWWWWWCCSDQLNRGSFRLHTTTKHIFIPIPTFFSRELGVTMETDEFPGQLCCCCQLSLAPILSHVQQGNNNRTWPKFLTTSTVSTTSWECCSANF